MDYPSLSFEFMNDINARIDTPIIMYSSLGVRLDNMFICSTSVNSGIRWAFCLTD